MNLKTFKLEEYLAKYEFSAPYLLCCSDAESFSLQEILQLANSEEQKIYENLRLGYTETKGAPMLRDTIAAQMYPGLNSENIPCFSGAEDGIFCTLFALCDANDHVIVVTPIYQSLLEIPQMKQANITTIALKEEQHWKLDLNEVKKAIKPNTKCMIINFPHNPTGQILTSTELSGLINILREHDIWLFSDEVYRLLGIEQDELAEPAACLYEKAISLGVMSKAFGMAGLRIGWIACQNKEILNKIEKIKHYTSICNSALSEVVSIIALRNKDKILSRNNAIVAKNLKLLDDFFLKYSHTFRG